MTMHSFDVGEPICVYVCAVEEESYDTTTSIDFSESIWSWTTTGVL